jgi:hypothetical protein
MFALKLTEALNGVLAVVALLTLIVISTATRRTNGCCCSYSLTLKSRTVTLQMLICLFATFKGTLHIYASSVTRDIDPDESICRYSMKLGTVAFVTSFSIMYLFLAHKVHSITQTFPKIYQRLFFKSLLILTYLVVLVAPIVATFVTSGRYVHAFDTDSGAYIDVCTFSCPYQATLTLAVVDLFLNITYLFNLVMPLKSLANMTHESGELDATLKVDEIKSTIRRNVISCWMTIAAAAISFVSYTLKEFTDDAFINIIVDGTSPLVLIVVIIAVMYSTAPAWKCQSSQHSSEPKRSLLPGTSDELSKSKDEDRKRDEEHYLQMN